MAIVSAHDGIDAKRLCNDFVVVAFMMCAVKNSLIQDDVVIMKY